MGGNARSEGVTGVKVELKLEKLSRFQGNLEQLFLNCPERIEPPFIHS